MMEPAGERKNSKGGGGTNVADHWMQHLRKAARESTKDASNVVPLVIPGNRGAGRPPSSTTESLRLSTNPSLLSMDNSSPTSPTTTVATSYPPSPRASRGGPTVPPYRHSAAPVSSQQSASTSALHPQNQPRSHASLPVNPSHQPPHRHRDQAERVYSEAKYDAEFDRGSSRTPGASSSLYNSNQLIQSTSSGSRGLFNPDNSSGRLEIDPRRREREDGTVRRLRSKREPVEVGDLGGKRGKESKESFESLEGEESGRPGSRSSKEGRHRRRRDGEGRRREDEGVSSTPAPGAVPNSSGTPVNPLASAGSASRQLFDPRRDDPVKFSYGHQSSSRKSKAASIVSDSRSFAGSTISLVSNSAASISEMSNGGDGNHQQSNGAGARDDPNPMVSALRRAYRDITELEAKVQDEHRAATTAAAREEEAGTSMRIQGGGKRYDDDYWVKLATSHKKLAEAHTIFLEMALDSRVPPSFHGLPQKYHTPSRLWQIGFHQLLEQMRHAISTTAPPIEGSANVLEHLIEFIQYAYTHYSQLFEDPRFGLFRTAWIEQLGDLARYRMAVAGMASRVTAAQSTSTKPRLEFGDSPREIVARPIEEASIGEAALGDWEIEEQETWRVMARDWYGQGVGETPGAGRLHHHLALLSKGDELKGLYHYSKSLTAAHPYLSARESILPLFEDDLQARRTQPDVTKAELFVHLHGMLFTKISLDDFDECLDRFLERLKEDACLIDRSGGDFASLQDTSIAPFGDAEWSMIAIINIAALLQFGAEDGVIKKTTDKELTTSAIRPSSSSNSNKARAPQAIMLNPSSLKRSEVIGATATDEDGASLDTPISPQTGGQVVQLAPLEEEDDPLVFCLAQRLTFGILDILLQHPYRVISNSKVVNPYIILLLTFLSHVTQQSATLKHLEKAIPWSGLVALFNTIPTTIEIRMDVQAKLPGAPLPEDWCLRGMDWTGRSLFARGFWKASGSSSKRDEMPPIGPPSARSVESEMDALKFNLDFIDEDRDLSEDGELPSGELAANRWRRVATTAAWFARTVAGIDYDSNAIGRQTKFHIAGMLGAKLNRWKLEEVEAAEAERESKAKAMSKSDEEEQMDEEESESEEELDNPDDTEDVRELKIRRRQLRAVIKAARLATRGPQISSVRSSSKKQSSKIARSALNVFAGYTVLVFDTNVLLAEMKLFRDLVESAIWTIVVPLAVITELDGLKRNTGPLGAAAIDAITYLETAIKSHPLHLKVQTSRGNYLKDLAIRSETIDFGGNGGDLGVNTFSHDLAKSMDDVILRAVTWQKDHFTSRLALVNPKADRRQVPANCSTVVLVSFDRNLRLKSRARGLDAVDEKEVKLLLENG